MAFNDCTDENNLDANAITETWIQFAIENPDVSEVMPPGYSFDKFIGDGMICKQLQIGESVYKVLTLLCLVDLFSL